MSTRASVLVVKEGHPSASLYHHCDGYPEGVGEEVSSYMRKKNLPGTPEGVAEYIEDDDSSYMIAEIPGDIEYLYTVDLDSREIECEYIPLRNRPHKQVYRVSFDTPWKEVEKILENFEEDD